GSCRRTLLYQWLGNRAANAVWFYIAKPPSASGMGVHQTVSLTILDDACQHLLQGESPATLVIEFTELELTHLLMLLPGLERARQHIQVILLCERCDPSLYEAVRLLHFTVLG